MSIKHGVYIDKRDRFAKKISVMTAGLAVLLTIFTIGAHRAHSKGIELQSDANDLWSHYQGKRIRDYQLEMNEDLINVLGANNPTAASLMAEYKSKHDQYEKELEVIKHEAYKASEENKIWQVKALYLDFSEGVLEISLVLTSLYFLARKKIFPRLGFFFGIMGILIGVYGFIL